MLRCVDVQTHAILEAIYIKARQKSLAHLFSLAEQHSSLWSLLVRLVGAGVNGAIVLRCAPKTDQTSVLRPLPRRADLAFKHTSERFGCCKIWPSSDPSAGRPVHTSRSFNGIVLRVNSGLLKSSLGECVPTRVWPLTGVAAFLFVSTTPLLIQMGALFEKEPKRLKNFNPQLINQDQMKWKTDMKATCLFFFAP